MNLNEQLITHLKEIHEVTIKTLKFNSYINVVNMLVIILLSVMLMVR